MPEVSADRQTHDFGLLSTAQVDSGDSSNVIWKTVAADRYTERTECLNASSQSLASDLNGDQQIGASDFAALGSAGQMNTFAWLDANSNDKTDLSNPAFEAFNIRCSKAELAAILQMWNEDHADFNESMPSANTGTRMKWGKRNWLNEQRESSEITKN